MNSVTFSRYKLSDYLQNEEDVLAYLTACAEEGDEELLQAARADVLEAGFHNLDFYDKPNLG